MSLKKQKGRSLDSVFRWMVDLSCLFMHLTPEAIAEYQALHKKEFGEDITLAEAEIRGKELCALFKSLINHKYKKWATASWSRPKKKKKPSAVAKGISKALES